MINLPKHKAADVSHDILVASARDLLDANTYAQLNPVMLQKIALEMSAEDKTYLPDWGWCMPEALKQGATGDFEDHEAAVLYYFILMCSVNACFWKEGFDATGTTTLSRWSYGLAEGSAALADYWVALYNSGKMPGFGGDQTAFLNEVQRQFSFMHLVPERVEALRQCTDMATMQQLLRRLRARKAMGLKPYNLDAALAIVEALPCFEDPFFKKAQLALGMAAGWLNRQEVQPNPTWWKDSVALTGYADYRIPQVLRHLGAVRYASALATQVDWQRLIVENTPEEQTLRAVTVVALDAIARLAGCSDAHVDAFLFLKARKLEKAKELTQPHHLTVTLNY